MGVDEGELSGVDAVKDCLQGLVGAFAGTRGARDVVGVVADCPLDELPAVGLTGWDPLEDDGACAPLIPSGWLWVTSALFLATFNVSSKDEKANPMAATRMAAPLPQVQSATAMVIMVSSVYSISLF